MNTEPEKPAIVGQQQRLVITLPVGMSAPLEAHIDVVPQATATSLFDSNSPPQWVRSVSRFLKIIAGGTWVFGGTLLATAIKVVFDKPPTVLPAGLVIIALGSVVLFLGGACIWLVAEMMSAGGESK